jgi:hypothetical protein
MLEPIDYNTNDVAPRTRPWKLVPLFAIGHLVAAIATNLSYNRWANPNPKDDSLSILFAALPVVLIVATAVFAGALFYTASRGLHLHRHAVLVTVLVSVAHGAIPAMLLGLSSRFPNAELGRSSLGMMLLFTPVILPMTLFAYPRRRR